MNRKLSHYLILYNWPLQTFSQDDGLASHITHVVCVHFIREWRDLTELALNLSRIHLRNLIAALAGHWPLIVHDR